MGRQDNSHDIELERRLEAWASAQASEEFPPGERHAIRSTLAGSLTPVKPIASPGRLAFGLVSILVLCASLLIAIMDKAGFHLMSVAQVAGIAAILFAGAILFSLSLASQMIPGSRYIFRFSGVLTLTSFAAITGIALLFPWRISRAFVAEGWLCAVMEVSIAIPAAGLFWLFARRGALLESSRLGATLGGLAALLALMVQQFQCMFPQAPHLLVWHVGVGGALIGLATLIGSWRKAPPNVNPGERQRA